jgi:hypothetical protein
LQNILGVHEQAQGRGTYKGFTCKGEGKSKTVQGGGVGFISSRTPLLKDLLSRGSQSKKELVNMGNQPMAKVKIGSVEVAVKVIFPRLLKNAQMQGTRNPEE